MAAPVNTAKTYPQTYPHPSTLANDVFRAYDIRGTVEDKLTPDLVYWIGRALGSELRQLNKKTIAVGYDGRHSSPILNQALCAGLLATGIDVIHIGMSSSPILYFACFKLNTDAGVIITGSHNPPGYNGLKILIDKQTLTEEQIQQLKNRITEKNYYSGQGKQSQVELKQDYINAITDRVSINRPLKVVIDCGNGVGALVAEQLFTQLGCEIIPLFCEVDGNFPNHHPDPSIADNLQDLIKTVQQEQADIGLAFDGDADRLGVVTNLGHIIWPDRQMMAFVQYFLAKHPQAPIIYDIKCSKNLGVFIKNHGGTPIIWKTGHSLIKAKMHAEKSVFAGEMSGHLFFGDPWFGFDDGLYAGALLCQILSTQSLDADQWFKQFPESINTPEIKINIDEDQKFSLIEKLHKQAKFPGANIITIDGLRIEFEDGWGLIRASNTTPCLTLRFEADSTQALNRIQSLIKSELLKAAPTLVIPF